MIITAIRQFYHCSTGKVFHLVKVETDQGIYGVGDATLRVKTPAIRECINLLNLQLKGRSVYDLESWFYKYFVFDRWRGGAIMTTAISAVEMAIWDTIGKKHNQPVYNLLGGKIRDKIPLYGNGWVNGYGGSKSIPEAAKNVVKRGFKALKFDPLSYPPFEHKDRNCLTKAMIDEAVDIVSGVRAEVGPQVKLFIELHGRCDFDLACRFIKRVEPYDISFIEEPFRVDDWDAYKRLREISNIPITAGERISSRFGHRRLHEEGAISIDQIDVAHGGGIWECKKVGFSAKLFGIKMAYHNAGSPYLTMASAHIDATLPNFYMQEQLVPFLDADPLMNKVNINFKDGCIILDDSVPGLGLIPDFDKLQSTPPEYETKDW